MFSADYTPWFLIFSLLYIPFEFPILPSIKTVPADFNLLKNQVMPSFNTSIHMTNLKPSKHNMWFPGVVKCPILGILDITL